MQRVTGDHDTAEQLLNFETGYILIMNDFITFIINDFISVCSNDCLALVWPTLSTSIKVSKKRKVKSCEVFGISVRSETFVSN